MDGTNHAPGNPAIRHETTDVNVWAVGKFGIGLVFVMVISIIMLFMLLRFFQSREETAVSNTVDIPKVFPEPRLQSVPVLDLRAIRTEELNHLNSYGWVDPQKGLVRIPIDVAIDVLAKRGLPSRPADAASTAPAVAAPVLPKESSHAPLQEEPKK